ncbi:MAG: 16S rRNA (cytosine(1402)-N(4))-methyltransferase RsmH [Oscillospiraceae bacterium]|nr:16S rRNA (cytosine(1402)-N(4))-methyltransferase RsmH [Oscillospiraceae bacterium]
MTQFSHVPVMLDECIDALNIRPDGIYVDGTFGRGGHSRVIASKLKTGRLICIDRDEAAISVAEELAKELPITPVRGNFRDIKRILNELSIPAVDGILLDLGISSPQLDEAERGFSYMKDAPLDMRMDQSQTLTAADVVNGWPKEELERILFDYGEERYARNIAAAIVRRREQRPIETTLELADVIRSAMPGKALREEQHPAKRSFQGIRIAVNDELAAVEEAVGECIDVLAPGGRLAIITFHSLEDRIVKVAYKNAADPCTCPPEFPVCVCGKKPTAKQVGRKPTAPSDVEVKQNPRARSAKLRVAEKI